MLKKEEERHGLSKKYGPMKVLEKKEKKGTHEGLKKRKKERRRDSHALKRFHRERERDHIKGVSIPFTIIHTRAHLDLIV